MSSLNTSVRYHYEKNMPNSNPLSLECGSLLEELLIETDQLTSCNFNNMIVKEL